MYHKRTFESSYTDVSSMSLTQWHRVIGMLMVYRLTESVWMIHLFIYSHIHLFIDIFFLAVHWTVSDTGDLKGRRQKLRKDFVLQLPMFQSISRGECMATCCCVTMLCFMAPVYCTVGSVAPSRVQSISPIFRLSTATLSAATLSVSTLSAVTLQIWVFETS